MIHALYFCTDKGQLCAREQKGLKAYPRLLTLTSCHLDFESPSTARCVFQVHHDQVVDRPAVAVILEVRELIFGL